MEQSVTAQAGITCEKCKTGGMFPTTTARFSSALRLIGYVVLIPSILMVLASGGCTALACATGMKGMGDTVAKSKENFRAAMEANTALSDSQRRAVLADLDDDLSLKPETIAALPEAQRASVQAAEDAMRMDVSTSAGASTAVGMAGTAITGVLFVLSLPFLVIGFVLTLTKKVWQCNRCGFYYDRA